MLVMNLTSTSPIGEHTSTYAYIYNAQALGVNDINNRPSQLKCPYKTDTTSHQPSPIDLYPSSSRLPLWPEMDAQAKPNGDRCIGHFPDKLSVPLLVLAFQYRRMHHVQAHPVARLL